MIVWISEKLEGAREDSMGDLINLQVRRLLKYLLVIEDKS